MIGSFFLFYLFMLLPSCKDEVWIFEPGPMEYGKATAKKNGEEWTASAVSVKYDPPYENYFRVDYSTFEQGLYLRESILLGRIPTIIGKNKVYKLSQDNFTYDKVVSGYGLTIDDGDVAGDFYNLDESADDNEIEVTYIDTIAGIARGRFTVTFKIVPPIENPNAPECVKFSDGTFEAAFM